MSKIIFSNIFTLVDILMNKDPDKISNVLSFLSKVLEKYENEDEEEGINNIREMFGEMFGHGNGKNIFYLVKCPEFGGKSLLWYINSENVRLIRQREELIDLSVKIANMNHREDSEKAMEEVINNYKSGLASGVGLRDMINMIKERYSWSSSKKNIMILVSLVACLLGIGLYGFDLTTDVQFSLEMFNRTDDSIPLDFPTFDFVFKKSSQSVPEDWKVDMREALENCWDGYHNVSSEPENNTVYIADMETTGWFAIWHCIQPFLVTFIVIFSMNYKEIKSKSLRDFDDDFWVIDFNCECSWFCCFCLPFYVLLKLVWKLGVLLLLLASFLPLPVFTHIYMFYLNVRFSNARRNSDFKNKMESIESEIQKYEALGKSWKDQ